MNEWVLLFRVVERWLSPIECGIINELTDRWVIKVYRISNGGNLYRVCTNLDKEKERLTLYIEVCEHKLIDVVVKDGVSMSFVFVQHSPKSKWIHPARFLMAMTMKWSPTFIIDPSKTAQNNRRLLSHFCTKQNRTEQEKRHNLFIDSWRILY